MKKILLFLLLLNICLIIKAQNIDYVPWKDNLTSKREKTTLEHISKSAEKYFSTIDRNKKGSGLKPFKRWEYHWSHYLLEDGTIAPSSHLLKAWNQKNELRKTSNSEDNSNWIPLGPYTSTNRYSTNNFKQTGQGRVNVIAVDPNNTNIYYVGTPAGGIWKSTNKGTSWIPLTDHLPQIGVSGIAIDPNNSNVIYIATGDDDAGDSYSIGVWKSTDGGSTWNSTSPIPGNPNFMNDIYVNPNNSQIVIVATSSGVQKSIDGGTTWQTTLSGNIRDLKIKPGNFNTMYAASSNTIYKSSDSGNTFNNIAVPSLSNSSRIAIDVTAANPNYVYFVSANYYSSFNGIYKSTDSGTTFNKTSETSDIFGCSQAWYDLDITVSSINENIVYVGVLDIWKSINGGDSFTKLNSWSNPNSDNYTHADIHYLSFKNNLLFAGTDGGIYVSNNEGQKFTDLTAGLAISQFYKIGISPQKPNTVAGGLQDNGGYAFTNESWKNYHGGDGMESLINPNNPNIIYGFMQYGACLFSSTDGGSSLKKVITAPTTEINNSGYDYGGRWVTPLVSNNQGEIFAGYSQLYKFENNSWTKISNHNFGGDLYTIEIDPNNNNIIYVSRSGNSYKSIDGGVTFSSLFSISGIIQSIEISNTNSNIGWIITSSSVYKSTNLLSDTPSFFNITGNLPSEGKTVIKHHARSGNNTIYLGTNLGVYYTNDDLNNQWKTYDNKLPNTQIRDLEIDEEESIIYVATYGRGVFYSTIPRMIPPKDVKLISVINPANSSDFNNGFNCGDDVTAQVKIKNNGANPITSVDIVYGLDNNVSKSYTWNGNLTSDETTFINLPSIASDTNHHNLKVNITTNDDAYQSNNSVSIDVTTNKKNNDPTITNTFENTEDELLVETNNQTMWEIGTPTKSLIRSNNKVYTTKVSGNYPYKTTGYLYSKCYDLTKLSNPILKFDMAFDIEKNWDYMYVEYTLDHGLTWSILGTANDPNWYNSSTTTNDLPGKQWTGEGELANSLGGKNADIHEYSYNLSAFTNQESFTYRFVFVADEVVSEEGVIIDNLVIQGTTLSLNESSILKNISIFPNPSDGIFNISRNTLNDLDFDIYDLTGKKVMSKEKITTLNYALDLSNFTTGIYLIKIHSNNKYLTKKLLIN